MWLMLSRFLLIEVVLIVVLISVGYSEYSIIMIVEMMKFLGSVGLLLVIEVEIIIVMIGN